MLNARKSRVGSAAAGSDCGTQAWTQHCVSGAAAIPPHQIFSSHAPLKKLNTECQSLCKGQACGCMSRLHHSMRYLFGHACGLSHTAQISEEHRGTEPRLYPFPTALCLNVVADDPTVAPKDLGPLTLQELLCFQRGDTNNFSMLGCFQGLTMATN